MVETLQTVERGIYFAGENNSLWTFAIYSKINHRRENDTSYRVLCIILFSQAKFRNVNM